MNGVECFTNFIFLCFGMLVLKTSFLVVKANVILSPSSALAAVGESFTWTCTYSGSETVSGFQWKMNGKLLAVILSPSCTPFDTPGPPDPSLYEYACLSANQATFTVKQISNMNNNISWQCAVAAPGYIFSNNVNVTVQGFLVVKANVILSPSSALAAVGESFTWTCTYSGSETVSGFQWKMNGKLLAVILSPSCTPFDTPGPPDPSLYEYACLSANQATFTVKQISNMNNNISWQCAVAAPGYIFSDNVNVTVQVSVSSVSLTPPTGTIRENVETTFTCETSTSRPAANITWYKESITGQKQVITSEVSSTTENVGDLEKSKSELKYTPSRSDNTYKIYCQALSIPGRTPVMSTKFQMDVQYSPESAPYIKNYANGSTYKVIENKHGTLSCNIKGGNPLATLTWNCFNNGLSTVISGSTVTKTVTWSATRGTDRSCTCQSSHPVAGTQSVSVHVQVLYKPDRAAFKVKGNTVSGPINFIDGKSSYVVCESNSKPNPDSYSWNKAGSSTIGGTTLAFNPAQKQDDGQYTCTANNTMVPSSGDAQIGSNSSTVKINVLFPPSTPSLHYGTIIGQQIPGDTIAVIEDVQFTVVCKSEANPEPAYTWTGQTVGNASLTIRVNEENQKKTCTATNTMMETQGVTQQGSSSTLLTFIMLYSPEIKDCKLQYNNGSSISVSNNIDVKEFSSFTITCSVNSKPEATTSWLGHITSSTKTLNVNGVNRQQNGTYTIFASNRMEPTFGGIKRGNFSKSFNFNILYSPKTAPLNNKDIVAGSNVSVQCLVTKGNPESTTFKWTRNGDSTSWKTQTLYIQNVTKNDDMMYTCTVQNIMKPTGRSQEIGTDSGSFHLNVLYMAQINSFTIQQQQQESATVNETDKVEFKCTVSSNPSAVIEIRFDDKILHRQENIKYLLYTRKNVACLDAGKYTCAGRNKYNNGQDSMRHMQLNVRCSPRPLRQMTYNYTSLLHTRIILSFTTLAYPVPGSNGFIWHKKHNLIWIPLLSNIDLSISSSDLQTNLTIKNVSQSDYGNYRVTVTNELGNYEQYLFLTEKAQHITQETQETKKQQADNTVLLVGVILGVICAALVLYAIILTVVLKRNFKLRELQFKSIDKSAKQTTYVNQTFNNHDPRQVNAVHTQFDFAAENDNGGNAVDDYTDLTPFSNENERTYDVINKP